MNNLNKKSIIHFIVPVIILSFISLLTLKFIGPLLADNVSHINYFSKQLVGFILGLTGIVVIYKMNLRKIYPIITIIYWILIVMLFILAFNPPIIGHWFVNNNNGADGWFMFFTPKLSFQPVEFFKLFLILKLADISNEHLINKTKDSWLIKQYIYYGFLPIILVLLEPDLGGTLLLVFPTIVMLIASLKDKKVLKKWFLISFIILLISVPLIFTDKGQNILVKITPLQSYQLDRLDSWLNPFDTDGGYQLQQSLILIGSAGPTGYGGGFDSIQISEAQTDLIFAAIIGFWGWIIGILVIGCYFYLIYSIIDLGQRQTSFNNQILCVGIASLFFLQVFENIGMVIGLLPITGIVLPYLSYGTSAIITYCAILGVILNIATSE